MQKLIAVTATMFVGFCANADVYVEAVPTGWRLQTFLPNIIMVYYTGSPCIDGYVSSDNMSSDDKNRFYATIMSAKIAQKKIGLYYETTSGTCKVTSYFLKEG